MKLGLSKNDPIYYRNKINSLIKEAQDRDIGVTFEQYMGKQFLSFRDIGTTVSINLSELALQRGDKDEL